MKLRNLTGAVRKTEGPVFADLHTSAGVLRVPLQKTGLLVALKDLALDPQDETEMSVDDAGLLTWRAPRVCAVTGTPDAPLSEQIDDDLLTGDGSGEALPPMDDDNEDGRDPIAGEIRDLRDDLLDLLL